LPSPRSLIAWLQWSTLRDATEASKQSVRVAERAIDASKESAANQLIAFEREAKIRLRGYVNVVVKIQQFEVGKPMKTAVSFVAIGDTPIDQVEGWASGQIARYPMPSTVDLDTAKPKTRGNKGILFPGNPLSINMESGSIVAESDLEKVGSGAYRFYAWGRVDYRDIFECHRWIEFCHAASWVSPSNPTFEFCPTHNQTDDPKTCRSE
jgi:hypothetical protein